MGRDGRNDASGFLHDQRSCGVIPRRKTGFKEGVGPPCGDIAQVEGSRTAAAQIAAGGVKLPDQEERRFNQLAIVRRGSAADQGLVQRDVGNVQRSAVEMRAHPAHGGEKLA